VTQKPKKIYGNGNFKVENSLDFQNFLSQTQPCLWRVEVRSVWRRKMTPTANELVELAPSSSPSPFLFQRLVLFSFAGDVIFLLLLLPVLLVLLQVSFVSYRVKKMEHPSSPSSSFAFSPSPVVSFTPSSSLLSSSVLSHSLRQLSEIAHSESEGEKHGEDEEVREGKAEEQLSKQAAHCCCCGLGSFLFGSTLLAVGCLRLAKSTNPNDPKVSPLFLNAAIYFLLFLFMFFFLIWVLSDVFFF
jgi:hypothetical protein